MKAILLKKFKNWLLQFGKFVFKTCWVLIVRCVQIHKKILWPDFWVNLTTHLFEANIWANKISLPQGQSYTEKEYYNGSKNLNLNFREWLMINLKWEQ